MGHPTPRRARRVTVSGRGPSAPGADGRVEVIERDRARQKAQLHRLAGVEHRQHKGLNNQAEVSHQPTRQQERQMRGFKSAAQAQRFLSVHAPINNLFRPRRHRMTAADYRAARQQAFKTWQQATCAQSAP